MLRIGPAGNSDEFYEQGYKHTKEAFPWIRAKGLNAFEYSFGKGVRLSEDTAKVIKAAAEKEDVQLSVHAPYYINFSGLDPEKLEATDRYLLDSLAAAELLGAKRCVFHPGSCSNMDRQDALNRAMRRIEGVLAMIAERKLDHITVCPETMGKINQLGTLEEVVAMCTLDERMIPTIDFGHLHARSLGGIQSKDDYRRILDYIGEHLGEDRMKRIHVHFSKIQFTQQGEKMHRTFAEVEFGPDFEPLCELIVEYAMSPVIICESKGTMAMDAESMLQTYKRLVKKQ